jgi:hypothetical protein
MTRNGKIARLPLAIRQELNQRLQDGQKARQLVPWLNSLPEVQAVLAAEFNGIPITERNLSRWKAGGYRSWEQDQKAREGLASFLEEAGGLKAAAQEGLTDRMVVFVAVRMALQLKQWDALPDGAEKSKIWHELLGDLVLLRRGDLHGERIVVEKEKLGFRRELHQRDREAEFWQWIEKEEYRDRILEKLLTPEQNDAEIERRNEEKRRRVKEILGIR